MVVAAAIAAASPTRRSGRGERGFRLVAEGPGRRRSSCADAAGARRRRPAPAAAGGPPAAAGRAVRADHPLRRAAGHRARQLGRAGRRARGRARRRRRGETPGRREIADLACRLEGSRGRHPRRQAGPVHGGVRRLPPARVPRSRRRRSSRSRSTRRSPTELERRMLLCYTGASRFSGTTIGRVMRAYERGDPAVAGALRRAPRGRRARWPRRSRAGDLAAIGALLERELAAPADARPRHVHAADGAARGARCATPARSAARRRARAPAARCSSSAPTIPAAARGPRQRAGHATPAGALGRDGRAARADRRRARARRRERSRRRPTSRALARAARGAGRPLLRRAAGRPARQGAALRRRRRLSRATAPRSCSIPGAPTRIAVPRAAGTSRGERHDRAWARCQHLWLAERAAELAALARARPSATDAAEAAAAASSRRTPRATPTIPTATTCSDPAGCSSPPISSPSGSPTTSRPRGCCGRRRCSIRRLADGVSARRRRGREPHRRVRRGLLQPADLAQRRARRPSPSGSRTRSWPTRAVEGPTGIARPPAARASATTGCGTRARTTTSSRLRGQLARDGLGPPGRRRPARRTRRLAARLAAALRAPALTALPDLTFPARKDSRFGVSLAQPMYLELWEVGLARLGDAAIRSLGLAPRALRRRPRHRPSSSTPTCTRPAPSRRRGPRSRADLSWWALLEMAPALPDGGRAVGARATLLLESQGLAILRRGDRYASLECGALRRRPRPPRPAASHAARRRPALAARSRAPART